MNHNPEGPSLDELNAALWNSLGTAGFPLQPWKHHAQVRQAANLLLGYLRTFGPDRNKWSYEPLYASAQRKTIVGYTVRDSSGDFVTNVSNEEHAKTIVNGINSGL